MMVKSLFLSPKNRIYRGAEILKKRKLVNDVMV